MKTDKETSAKEQIGNYIAILIILIVPTILISLLANYMINQQSIDNFCQENNYTYHTNSINNTPLNKQYIACCKKITEDIFEKTICEPFQYYKN